MRFLSCIFLFVIAFSCGSPSPDEKTKDRGWRKHALYPKYALGFTVYENDQQVKFTSRDPHDTTTVYSEVLFDKNADGTVKPQYKTLCLTSTTHSFLFDALGASHMVKGMSAMNYLQDTALVEKYRKQGVVHVGQDDQLNREIIVNLRPDAMMVYPYEGGDYSDYVKAGITVLYNAEYLEENPLGRAEWIKFAGLVAAQESLAESVFDAIRLQYEEAKKYAAQNISTVSVILGKPIDNVWHVPGNQSFAAQMVKDAGAQYRFEEVQGNNVQSKSTEWVLTHAADAHCWLFTDYTPQPYNLEQLKSQNKIYPHLDAVKNGRVYVCNSSKADFFGKGVIEPHVMLKDMIFHLHGTPDNYKPIYFQKLE